MDSVAIFFLCDFCRLAPTNPPRKVLRYLVGVCLSRSFPHSPRPRPEAREHGSTLIVRESFSPETRIDREDRGQARQWARVRTVASRSDPMCCVLSVVPTERRGCAAFKPLGREGKKKTPCRCAGSAMIPRNAKLHGPYLLSSRLYCRLRSFTESATFRKGKARGLYRRWGLSPRPEDIHSKWPVDSIIEFSLIHDPVICNRFFAWKNLEQKNRLPACCLFHFLIGGR